MKPTKILPAGSEAKVAGVLAAGALLSVTGAAAHAGIIYTPDNTIISTAGTASDNIKFGAYTFTGASISASTTNGIQLNKGVNNTFGEYKVGAVAGTVKALNAGDASGPVIVGDPSYASPLAAPFGPGPGLIISANGATGEYTGAAGIKYISFQFQDPAVVGTSGAGTAVYNAWIGFQTLSTGAVVSGQMAGFAYESVPFASITMGQIPEPASLGILAMGAAGVAMYRGRRRVA